MRLNLFCTCTTLSKHIGHDSVIRSQRIWISNSHPGLEATFSSRLHDWHASRIARCLFSRETGIILLLEAESWFLLGACCIYVLGNWLCYAHARIS